MQTELRPRRDLVQYETAYNKYNRHVEEEKGGVSEASIRVSIRRLGPDSIKGHDYSRQGLAKHQSLRVLWRQKRGKPVKRRLLNAAADSNQADGE